MKALKQSQYVGRNAEGKLKILNILKSSLKFCKFVKLKSLELFFSGKFFFKKVKYK